MKTFNSARQYLGQFHPSSRSAGFAFLAFVAGIAHVVAAPEDFVMRALTVVAGLVCGLMAFENFGGRE